MISVNRSVTNNRTVDSGGVSILVTADLEAEQENRNICTGRFHSCEAISRNELYSKSVYVRTVTLTHVLYICNTK